MLLPDAFIQSDLHVKWHALRFELQDY